MGRPKKHTPEEEAEIQAYICERIAKGDSLNKLCKAKNNNVPHYSQVMRWLEASESFREKYARAREDSADHYADEIVAIADEESDPNRARVRIDARKWVASKLKPKKYGDRTTLDTDPDRPLQVVTTIRLVAQSGSRD